MAVQYYNIPYIHYFVLLYKLLGSYNVGIISCTHYIYGYYLLIFGYFSSFFVQGGLVPLSVGPQLALEGPHIMYLANIL